MTTTIWEQIKSLYEKSDRTFINDLQWHLANGYVFAGPTYFIMGSDFGGGWHIHLGVGDMSNFFRHIPYHLPYIGWSRDATGNGNIKWYKTERLMRLMQHMRVEQEQQQHQLGGSLPKPPKPPAPPTKDDAALNVLNMGKKKPQVGFEDTDKGNNTSSQGLIKTLLGD